MSDNVGLLNVPKEFNEKLLPYSQENFRRLADAISRGNLSFDELEARVTALEAASADPVFRGARVWQSAQLISTHNATKLLWSQEVFDTDSIHSTSSDTGKLILNKIGYWNVVGQVSFEQSGLGTLRFLEILKNNFVAARSSTPPLAGTHTSLNASSILYASAITDFVEVSVLQDSGTNLNTIGSDGNTFFAASFLGE